MPVVILPKSTEYVEVTVEYQTMRYEYGNSYDEYGDCEVIDVTREHSITMRVPKISFLEWIECLIQLKNAGITFSHIYTKEFKAYEPFNSQLWDYFDEVKGNSLRDSSNFREDAFRMYVFWIEEFNYFSLIRTNNHKNLER